MTEFSFFFCMNNIPLKNTSWYFKNVDVVFHKIMFQLRQKIFLKCIFLGAYSHRSTVFIFCLVILYSLTVAEMQKHNIASLFSKMWLLGITAFFFVLLNDFTREYVNLIHITCIIVLEAINIIFLCNIVAILKKIFAAIKSLRLINAITVFTKEI